MMSSGFGQSQHRAHAADELRWYACYTRGRHEKKVTSHLDSRRIETFLPVHRLDVQWSDRRKTVDKPLFPSYVFARFRTSELQQVLNTRGLVTIIRAGGALAVIPDQEIENVRRFASAIAGHRIVPEREAVIEPGDRVRVLTGPLAGIEGAVVVRRGRRRLLVALSTVGEGLMVDLDDACLQRVGPRGPVAHRPLDGAGGPPADAARADRWAGDLAETRGNPPPA
ncbi:MAG TPA: UpxY family transcription antiterminator [Longimicrobium sp.]|nr:UpxY family transcription antiterminator [Longimicrobium sp.]